MHKRTIYLIGPIGGMSYEDATKWRLEAREVLEDIGYEVLDPMTGKECLKGETSIGVGLGNANSVKNGYIYHSDLHRINRADVLLANLLKMSDKQSIGTFFEYGYGAAKDKTIVTVTADPYVTAHPFIAASSIVVASLEEAYELLAKMTR